MQHDAIKNNITINNIISELEETNQYKEMIGYLRKKMIYSPTVDVILS